MPAEPPLPGGDSEVVYIVWVRIDATRYPLRILASSLTEALRRPGQDLHRGEPTTYRIGEGREVTVYWAKVATLEVFQALSRRQTVGKSERGGGA